MKPSDTNLVPCPRLEEDLVLFHYGELAGGERNQIEAHVKACKGCAKFLEELTELLPRTVLADDPPETFWTDYSRELRHKLADLNEHETRWQKIFALFRPWALPTLATAAVIALALTFTLGKGLWPNQETPPSVESALLEILPMAENLDFFQNLEVLDSLELLETMDGPSKGAA